MKNLLQISSILALPALEFAGIRFFQHSFFRIPVGWSAGTDFDFVLPLVWTHLVFVGYFSHAAPFRLRLQKGTCLLNLFLLAICLGTLAFAHSRHLEMDGFLRVFWVVSAIAVLASAYFCFLSPTYFLHHPKKKLVPLAVVMGLSMFLYQSLFAGVWPYLAAPTGSLVRRLSAFLLHSDVTAIFDRTTDVLRISCRNFHLLVGRGCGGGEGILIFSLCCLAFGLTNTARNKWPFALFVPLGLAFMLFLNGFRLVFLLAIAVVLRKFGLFDPKIFLFFIHGNVGWVMYAVAMYPLFRTLSFVQHLVDSFELPLHSRGEDFA